MWSTVLEEMGWVLLWGFLMNLFIGGNIWAEVWMTMGHRLLKGCSVWWLPGRPVLPRPRSWCKTGALSTTSHIYMLLDIASYSLEKFQQFKCFRKLSKKLWTIYFLTLLISPDIMKLLKGLSHDWEVNVP